MIAEETLKELNLHPVLKDIENIFWFFILSNVVLVNPEVQDIIKKGKDPSILPMLEKYNKWISLEIKVDQEKGTYHSTAKLLDSMIFIGKAMAILMYDFLSMSSYNTAINKQEEFKFLKFIRNGAAHYNKFNLKNEEGEWKLGENENVVWSGKKINRKLHNNKVFNDFVSMFDMISLARHFSNKLMEIDKKN